MPRIRDYRPRPLIHTVLGGVLSGITRTLLDWLLHTFVS
jgi:hypothetical protein